MCHVPQLFFFYSGFEGCSWNVRNVFQTFFWSCHVFFGSYAVNVLSQGLCIYRPNCFALAQLLDFNGCSLKFTSDFSKTSVSPQLWKSRHSVSGLWDLTIQRKQAPVFSLHVCFKHSLSKSSDEETFEQNSRDSRALLKVLIVITTTTINVTFYRASKSCISKRFTRIK